jgi:serine/threonine protein phosphatase PrpC
MSAQLEHLAPLQLHGAMLSNPGKTRSTNEDRAAYIIPSANDPRFRQGSLAIVADGMGGHAAGEVASDIAVEVISKKFYETQGSPGDALEAGLQVANATIYETAAQHVDLSGMGTTCTALVIRDSMAYWAHVGDSRLYLLRDSKLQQLSEDQSLVMDLVRSGAMTAEEARLSPERNIILRALGTRPSIEIEVRRDGLPLQRGDRLLLCSDGLTDLVDDEAIRRILSHNSPLDACEELIQWALHQGGDDNITVGVFALYDALPAVGGSVAETRSSL